MARKIFISFRYSDGHKYKEKLSDIFTQTDTVINCSEDEDRSSMTEDTIKRYLYQKLKSTSVTIVLLTPRAINHQKKYNGFNYVYDDWMYDEIRYSLDDRENNRCNGLIAVYTPEAKDMLIETFPNKDTVTIKNFDSFENLVRKNMFNIKSAYKHNSIDGIYDRNWDHYCSLISWDTFINNYDYYIELAEKKRETSEKYDIVKRL